MVRAGEGISRFRTGAHRLIYALLSDSASRNGSDPRARRVTVERVVALAYILAVAMPPLGFVFALGLAIRVRSKHWPWIVLVSIIAAVIWTVVIAAGGLKTTNQGY